MQALELHADQVHGCLEVSVMRHHAIIATGSFTYAALWGLGAHVTIGLDREEDGPSGGTTATLEVWRSGMSGCDFHKV